MNPIKTGKFIAELRRRDGMTQQQLGDRLGVTNKTISRWENANYMPDIEMLQLLSGIFNVSINELLAGQFLTDEEFREQAEKNIVEVSKESAFSLAEKKEFHIKKWRREHIWLYVIFLLLDIALLVYAFAEEKVIAAAAVPLIAAIENAYLHNRMMTYVENRIYGKK